jgi:hypothetical protein
MKYQKQKQERQIAQAIQIEMDQRTGMFFYHDFLQRVMLTEAYCQ